MRRKRLIRHSPLRSYLAYLNLKNAKGVLEKNKPFKSLGIYAENDRTLRIELDKPTPYLPEMLAHISLVPQYSDPDSPVTNGAYTVSYTHLDVYKRQSQ